MVERDIVNRLQAWDSAHDGSPVLYKDAIAEIVRLRAVLRCISQRASYGMIPPGMEEIRKWADAALANEREP